MSGKIFFILFVLLMLSGCSIFSKQLSWSGDIPPTSYYIEYYAQDQQHQRVLSQEDYLMWVNRFYYGWTLYRRGWVRATNELTASLSDPEDKQHALDMMFTIGKQVSAEWAKNKRHRVINTKHLSIWGNSLNQSVVKKEQLYILDRILEDVNLLLAQEIQPKDVDTHRYYPPINDDPFANL